MHKNSRDPFKYFKKSNNVLSVNRLFPVKSRLYNFLKFEATFSKESSVRYLQFRKVKDSKLVRSFSHVTMYKLFFEQSRFLREVTFERHLMSSVRLGHRDILRDCRKKHSSDIEKIL